MVPSKLSALSPQGHSGNKCSLPLSICRCSCLSDILDTLRVRCPARTDHSQDISELPSCALSNGHCNDRCHQLYLVNYEHSEVLKAIFYLPEREERRLKGGFEACGAKDRLFCSASWAAIGRHF